MPMTNMEKALRTTAGERGIDLPSQEQYDEWTRAIETMSDMELAELLKHCLTGAAFRMMGIKSGEVSTEVFKEALLRAMTAITEAIEEELSGQSRSVLD